MVHGFMKRTDLPPIEIFWERENFRPNENQKNAILNVNEPLLLTAGPGSGKTRVLLWRTLNLIVYHNAKPEEIFLATFTQKAAKQLKSGIQSLLASVSEETGITYDLSNLYVGTVHSLCRNILSDRRFSPDRKRNEIPALLTELQQFLLVYRRGNWERLITAADLEAVDAATQINDFFKNARGRGSRLNAVKNLIALFNRLSEESLEPESLARRYRNAKLSDIESRTKQKLIRMYGEYLEILRETGPAQSIDFALLQKKAFEQLLLKKETRSVFRHVIIDEYQDTNAIQEKIFFHLASGYENICVVGDDDQALYRFRGATVENLVQFEKRVASRFNAKCDRINLSTNYRSRSRIVDTFTRFMELEEWEENGRTYRIKNKNITANSADTGDAVVITQNESPEESFKKIAETVKGLIDTKKVSDPNQIAFLFPSLKTDKVKIAIRALESAGLKVYAPRAGNLLDTEESRQIFGILIRIFYDEANTGIQHTEYRDWLEGLYRTGGELMQIDPELELYVQGKRREIAERIGDYDHLIALIQAEGWDENDRFSATMREKMIGLKGLSRRCIADLKNKKKLHWINRKDLKYALISLTSLDSSILDFFYQLCGRSFFMQKIGLATRNDKDEGPLCNLGLISQYLAQYNEEFTSLITAHSLKNGIFHGQFFNSYLYVLYLRKESEYENTEDPFPRGRIPFLTIHQAKGLEFPVVVLGNFLRKAHENTIESFIRELVDSNPDAEPMGKIDQYDAMRMFYVALSRAKNLLIINNSKNCVQQEYQKLVRDSNFPELDRFYPDEIPFSDDREPSVPRTYSYTGDYIHYNQCPRHYMFFKKYDFVPSRSQTMFYGNLVHRTLEDLHHDLIRMKEESNTITEPFPLPRLFDAFEQNFTILRHEYGHAISREMKESARKVIAAYGLKFFDIANRITETEFHLCLPDQITEQGRTYSLEGVIDIVSESDRSVVYDIKTHDIEYFKNDENRVQDQLNVYAHIWQKLRMKKVDSMIVLLLSFTRELKQKIGSLDLCDARDIQTFQAMLEGWNPVKEFRYKEEECGRTIIDFGRTVDAIESHQFEAPDMKRLRAENGEPRSTLLMCERCDIRPGCPSHHKPGTDGSPRSGATDFPVPTNEADGDEIDFFQSRIDAEITTPALTQNIMTDTGDYR